MGEDAATIGQLQIDLWGSEQGSIACMQRLRNTSRKNYLYDKILNDDAVFVT